ncbi:BrnA antitoxin family protein [Paracoccus marinus]|uniref:BrnA antitoxin family protein n=1 Tax=Paracoccus marinus TaxID=288426 RepID=UPI00103D2994|nr:BrnA antitoxin family protein [Paracoccus marinus]GLS81091.1 hypothetical protein GCM10007893_18910 [Paracoccus marinus]
MSESSYKTYTLDEIQQMTDQTDLDRLRREGEFEGEDEDDFEIDWDSAVLVLPQAKKAISLRVDPDVLDFFRAEGKGYQTRMNAVLRAYMQARKAG